MRVLSLVSFILVIIGAVNWLLVGVSRFDLVRWLTGRHMMARRIIYSLVGTAGLTQLTTGITRSLRMKKAVAPA